MNAPFHQTIANDFADLSRLMEGATTFLESQGVDAQAVYRINLALEEMVTNIIKYGYDEPGRHQIEVTLEVGHDFNPILQERKQPAEKLEDREIGGLGIHLMKKLLDHLEHRREGGRNILEIKARRKPVPPPA